MVLNMKYNNYFKGNTKAKKILYKIFVGDTIPKKLFLFYLYAILLGVILLSLPISLTNIHEYVKYDMDGNKEAYTFVDILFTSISAFSDTGLSTMNVGATYNGFGEVVILLLVQVGGLGLFTIYWVFWNFILNSYWYKKKKNLSMYKEQEVRFSTSLLLSSERGNTKLGLTKDTIKKAVIFIFAVELIFWVLYTIFFATYKAHEQISVIEQVNNLDAVKEYGSLTINDPNKLVDCYHSPKAI